MTWGFFRVWIAWKIFSSVPASSNRDQSAMMPQAETGNVTVYGLVCMHKRPGVGTSPETRRG